MFRNLNLIREKHDFIDYRGAQAGDVELFEKIQKNLKEQSARTTGHETKAAQDGAKVVHALKAAIW
jgi:hypothetical protein